MLQGIDHLVVVVPDLDTAIANYTALGFTVVPGGRHPIGSHNALIAFEDGAYIELLAFYAPNPGHRWYAALQHGGGVAHFLTSLVKVERQGRAGGPPGFGFHQILYSDV